MRLKIVTLILATLLIVPSAQAGLTSMRGPLFETTDTARANAEANDAPLLAPVSYGEAAGYYERAENTFKRGRIADFYQKI
jgi:hypothetical protein